jgi:tetraacyldisaccharide 4'-kinase
VKARRPWAWPLVPLYAAGLAAKDGLRRVGALPTRRLRWPVVSVGSLSAGGAGKTPVVIALAGLLRERGWTVDVLSRGYGREGHGVERADASVDGAAARFGDEPVLIAQRTEVPVWVGADRFAAGVEAEGREADSSAALRNDNQEGGQREGNQKRVHLLDDGFQHRELARALDVVLVTAEDLEDALLPAGNRRERLGALGRADVVVVREEERDRVEARVRRFMRAPAAVWTVRRSLRLPEGETAGPKPLAFCGIARPDGFSAMIAQAGIAVVETVAFGDHHRYTTADVERLRQNAAERGATGFVTTEKDRVKLSAAMLERLQLIGPVCAVKLDAKFVDEADVMREVEARCR